MLGKQYKSIIYLGTQTECARVSTGNNETPRLTTTPASTLALEADGSTSQLAVIAAEDPRLPITYDHDTSPASPNHNQISQNQVVHLH